MAITRCSIKSVIDEVLSFSGQTRTQLDAGQLLSILLFINSRLRDWAWIAWPWPELTKVERRRFRLDWASGTAYSAPSATAAQEVFYPPTGFYYQALRASTGQAPAALTAGVYVTNTAYWEVCASSYAGDDWLDATAYIVSDVRRNPADGRFYQCYIAHTSSGTIDATKFGILTDFDPYVSRTQTSQTVIGDFLGMYLDDPRAFKNPRRVDYTTDALGAHPFQVRTNGCGWGSCDHAVPNEVWVKFRLKCPNFDGVVYAAGTAYTAGVDVIYFEGSTLDLEGDYWSCVTTTTAGQSPETTAAKWERLEFPLWLRTAVARRAPDQGSAG